MTKRQLICISTDEDFNKTVLNVGEEGYITCCDDGKFQVYGYTERIRLTFLEWISLSEARSAL